MKSVVLALALLGAPPEYLYKSPGVVVPQQGFTESRITLVGADGDIKTAKTAETLFSRHVEGNLPEDDRGKFHITVFLGNDVQSTRLKSDFEQCRELIAFRRWAKYMEIGMNTPADKEAHKLSRISKTPTITVFPTKGSKVFPWELAYRRVGYGGDAALLARNLYSALRQFYGRYSPQDCPGPYCPRPNPNPNPYQPNPGPSPNVDWPQPPALPDIDMDPVPSKYKWLVGITENPLLALLIAVAVFVAYTLFIRKGTNNVSPNQPSPVVGPSQPVQPSPIPTTPAQAPPSPQPIDSGSGGGANASPQADQGQSGEGNPTA